MIAAIPSTTAARRPTFPQSIGDAPNTTSGALAVDDRAIRRAAVAIGEHPRRQRDAIGGLAARASTRRGRCGSDGPGSCSSTRAFAVGSIARLDLSPRRRALRVEALDRRLDRVGLVDRRRRSREVVVRHQQRGTPRGRGRATPARRCCRTPSRPGRRAAPTPSGASRRRSRRSTRPARGRVDDPAPPSTAASATRARPRRWSVFGANQPRLPSQPRSAAVGLVARRR